MNKPQPSEFFTPEDYPKSYASIRTDDFRLKDYLNQDPELLRQLSDSLYLFCDKQADSVKLVTRLQDLSYIDSGWEWSVFKKNSHTVVKIPAGIFQEVNDPLYLDNTQLAYETIRNYFPNEFIANTSFHRQNDLNRIEQDFIESEGLDTIPFTYSDKKLFNSLEILLQSSLNMLDEMQWMPDFWLAKSEDGFELNNIVVQKETGLPKIIDFTFYFDPYRIHPEKTKSAVAESRSKIEEFLSFLKTK